MHLWCHLRGRYVSPFGLGNCVLTWTEAFQLSDAPGPANCVPRGATDVSQASVSYGAGWRDRLFNGSSSEVKWTKKLASRMNLVNGQRLLLLRR